MDQHGFLGCIGPVDVNDGFNLMADLGDDWLGPAVNAEDCTDFPDDAIAASLAMLPGGRDDEDDWGAADLQSMFNDRNATGSPGMRASFSMNDLTLMQQHQPCVWGQHKLVSMRPKLQPVPEGGPSNGGPLNLMPLPGSTGAIGLSGLSGNLSGELLPPQLPPLSRQLLDPSHARNISTDEGYVDLESEGLGYSHPSTGTLSRQLQMTHVKSDHQLHVQGGQMPAQHMPRAETLSGGQASTYRGMMQGGQAAGIHPKAHTLMGQQGMGQASMQDQGDPGPPVGAPPGMRRGPSGLPLRKSQSAVELGSWRNFTAGEEMWELDANGDLIKPWKLTPEERVARIQRYREKRMQRNFNRSVKYQCRKSLADTRPRVRGRFARNDDAGIVMPHETKKAQRERTQGSGSQDLDTSQATDIDTSSDPATSSGGVGPSHGPQHPSQYQSSTPSGMHLQASQNQHGATSQAAPMTGLLGMAPPPPPLGVSIIGGYNLPRPLSHSDMSGMGHLGGMVPSAGPCSGATYPTRGQNNSMMIPMQGMQSGYMRPPSSYPPMPPMHHLMQPSPTPGGIFSGASSAGMGTSSRGSYQDLCAPPPVPSMMTYSSMQQQQYSIPPLPYIPSSQTIFSSATMFSTSAAGTGPIRNTSQQCLPLSNTASAHPSLSPPMGGQTSPTASDSHSWG